MRGRPAFFAISMAAAGLVSIAPASAQPIDKGHFHDVETSSFDCDGTPVQQTDEVDVNFLFNQRGGSKHPFPYYRESVRETVTWTTWTTAAPSRWSRPPTGPTTRSSAHTAKARTASTRLQEASATNRMCGHDGLLSKPSTLRRSGSTQQAAARCKRSRRGNASGP